jgi:hypothetical protein
MSQERDQHGYPKAETYVPSFQAIEKVKKRFDDPSPVVMKINPKTFLPKSMYEELAPVSKETLSKEWAEVVGFKAPDLVGKICPEIKPGKYTYKDVQNNPAFKELMTPGLYRQIGPPGTVDFAGNISEFEIVPTQQYYYNYSVIKATRENQGKTKLKANGYLDWNTYVAGLPFPRPSGPQKAYQIMYDVEKRYVNSEDQYQVFRNDGFKNGKQDYQVSMIVRSKKLWGRTTFKPYGIYDNRAKEKGEIRTFIISFLSPRDTAGVTQSAVYYMDPDKPDNLMLYTPAMRRIRKLTSSDTQDPMIGQDNTYDDNEGFMQKLSATRYPYKMEVIGEREFLTYSPSIDGSQYVTSKGEFKNIKLERRPMYVVQLTQLDPSYVYSKRVIYVDKEMLIYHELQTYDRKGRLYRMFQTAWTFFPDVGSWWLHGAPQLTRDYIDKHSTVFQGLCFPAVWDRSDLSLERYMSAK